MSHEVVVVQCRNSRYPADLNHHWSRLATRPCCRLVVLPLTAATACRTILEHIPQARDEKEVIPIPDVDEDALRELMQFEPGPDWIVADTTWAQLRRLAEVALYLDFEPFLRYCASAIWSVRSQPVLAWRPVRAQTRLPHAYVDCADRKTSAARLATSTTATLAAPGSELY